MADVQLENGFIRIANEIWDEVLRRSFSKRQMDILQFIWRLSYGCQKKSATIPKLKHFELCGVGKTNITKELNYLTETKVIIWERDTNTFTFNKNYDYWQISPIKEWDGEKFKELVRLNLQKKLSKQEQSYQNDNQEVIKTITPKLSKQELLLDSIPWGTKGEGASKDSIKDSIKDSNKQQQKMTAYGLYQNNIRVIPSAPEHEALSEWITELGDSFVYKAIEECCKSAKDRPTFRFLEFLINQWISKGARNPDDIERLQNEFRTKRQTAPPVKQDKLPKWIESQEQAAINPKNISDEDKRKKSEELLKALEGG